MKILVTGGTGFTGSHLVERLLSMGHRVVAMDYKEGIKQNSAQRLRELGAEVIIGSVVDKPLVEKAMQGVELVHHLAAAFREMDVPESFYDEVNEGGTRNVAEAAFRQGVKKFIYCSTCGVHGNVATIPAGEDSPINPADYYQKTKFLGEKVTLEYLAKGMEATILRPAAIYGPGDPERFAMIFKLAVSGWFPMFGDGKTVYHPLYIDNLVDAFIAAMAPGVGLGQAYLIADDKWYPLNDLVARVGRAMGKEVRIVHLPFAPLSLAGHLCEKICKPLKISPPIFPRRVDWYRQNRAFDIGKAKRDLGYDPKVGIDEGLRRTYEWYLKARVM